MGVEVQIEYEHRLTEEELIETAREHVLAAEAHDKSFEEFKNLSATWRAKIKDAKKHCEELGKRYTTGLEKRKILALEHPNLDTKQFEYIFEGKILKTREMNAEDIARHGTVPMFDEPSSVSELAQVFAEETSKRRKRDVVTEAN